MSPLHQRLLELHYDLLPEADAAELRRRIESDPAVATAMREVRRTADLLGEAARLDAPPIDWHKLAAEHQPAAGFIPAVTDGGTPRRKPAAGSGVIPLGRSPAVVAEAATSRQAQHDSPADYKSAPLSTLLALAASVLLIVSLGGHAVQVAQRKAAARQDVRLLVAGPSVVRSGTEPRFTAVAHYMDGTPVGEEVAVRLAEAEPNLALKKLAAAHEYEPLFEDGNTDYVATYFLTIKDDDLFGDKLFDGAARQSLPVAATRQITRLSLDKESYRPGETVWCRAVVLDGVSLDAVDANLSIVLRDPQGNILAQAPTRATNQGIVAAALPLSPAAGDGRYKLAVAGVAGDFPAAEREFDVYRNGPPTANRWDVAFRANDTPLLQELALEEQRPAALGDLAVELYDFVAEPQWGEQVAAARPGLNVRFISEGGGLAADLENRVYFEARDERGQPAEMAGEVLDDQGRAVAKVATAVPGLGSFQITPRAKTEYLLRITEPADMPDRTPLPDVVARPAVAVSTPDNVLAAGEPLSIALDALYSGRPLVVAAYCRGALVGQQPVETQAGGNDVQVRLAEEASGPIRVAVYDYSGPPREVAQRYVYRRPAQRLNVTVEDGAEAFAPGEQTALSFAVTNEAGQPTAAALGVSVVLEAAAEEANLALSVGPAVDDGRVGISEVAPGTSYAASVAADQADAEATLDLLLGTLAMGRTDDAPAAATSDTLGRIAGEPQAYEADFAGDPPPAVFDNLPEVQARHEERLARLAERSGLWAPVAAAAAMALLLLAAMLTLLRLAGGARMWLPTLASAAVCLTLSVIWCSPPRDAVGTRRPVAFRTFNPPAAGGRTGESPQAASRPAGGELPAAGAESAWSFALLPPTNDLSDAYFAYDVETTDPTGAASPPETVFWQPLLQTDEAGRATIRFRLPPQAARYRVRVEAHAAGGRLGRAEISLWARPAASAAAAAEE